MNLGASLVAPIFRRLDMAIESGNFPPFATFSRLIMEVPRCPGNKLAAGIRLYTHDLFWWRPAKSQFSQLLYRIRERHQLQDTRGAARRETGAAKRRRSCDKNSGMWPFSFSCTVIKRGGDRVGEMTDFFTQPASNSMTISSSPMSSTDSKTSGVKGKTTCQ